MHDKENDLANTSSAKQPRKSSSILDSCSDKLNLSRAQQHRRRQKTLQALKPVHCASNTTTKDSKSNINNGLWTTLLGTATQSEVKEYISKSSVCMEKVLPVIVSGKFKEYERSKSNNIRSLRVLYEGGMIGKRKYTSIRNSSDIITNGGNKKKEVVAGCVLPKITPYKTLMKYVNSIDIGEVTDLEELSRKFSVPTACGVYRPLKPFLLRLTDLYIMVDKVNPCLTWFNGKENVMHIAIGADGAPFGKNDTATGRYSTSISLT